MYDLHGRSTPYYIETPFFTLGDGRPQPAKDFWKQASHEIYGYNPHLNKSTNEVLPRFPSSYSRLPQEIRNRIMEFPYKAEQAKTTIFRGTGIDTGNDLVIRKNRNPLLIERHGEDFFVDNGIVVQLPKWVSNILISKQFFVDALPFLVEGCVVRLEACTLQEVLPGLQKSHCLEWVVTNILRYA